MSQRVNARPPRRCQRCGGKYRPRRRPCRHLCVGCVRHAATALLRYEGRAAR